ncbi:hypothetical protein ACGFS9_02305 [Streptomyces sp. NPDC048566]|uniref:hypothetical protein n=1 Tax=Streptomyces sp. NPDC048566 TaxID=3365569 RepID=UPI00371448B2
MGIESDQLVFDYLSRVGDLAQQRQLPSATRMRLVTELRGEIDRGRAQGAADSPAAVRRLLERLGTPDAVVSAAGAGGTGPGRSPGPGDLPGPGPGAAGGPRPAAPSPSADAPQDRPRGLRRVVPRPRPAEPGPAGDADVPSPPHLAGAYELGDVTRPDWWRVTGSPFGLDDSVPGFTGGVEIPELLRPPPARTGPADASAKPAAGVTGPAGGTDGAGGKETAPAGLRGGLRARFRTRGRAGAATPGAPAVVAPVVVRRTRLGSFAQPLLLLAAALLVAGAVLGNWFALGLGWLIAYGSRRLTPAQSKWAVLVLPGLAVSAGAVWIWGRQDGRWGEPVAAGHMSDAMAETWPWVVRGAAVASALYLLWRSRRHP